MKTCVRALAHAMAGLGLWLSGATGHAAVTGEWDLPITSTLQVGTTFNVTFGVSGFTGDPGSSLGLYDMDVLYSSSSLGFVGGGFGPPGASGSNPLEFTEASASPFLGGIGIVSTGTVDAFGLSGNSQGVLDTLQPNSMSLFHLTFQTLAVDPAASIRVDLNDPYLLFGSSATGVDPGLTLGRSELLLQVTPAIPEPSSALLLGAGALALWGARRRQSYRANAQ